MRETTADTERTDSEQTSVDRGSMTVWVASDHAGFELKERVLKHLRDAPARAVPLEVHDGGPPSAARVNYPDLAWPLTERVAEALASGQTARGVLICGTGIGVSLVANRHPEIRAALAHNLFTAEMARRHNDAQILCLGARVIGRDLALAMIDVFLATSFEGGRHAERVELLQALTSESH